MTKKVIIDCDPGVDDALALFLAFRSPALDVLGITTVNGNVNLDHTTANALTLVEQADVDIPVYRGLADPLVKPRFSSSNIHGEGGLGGVKLPVSKRKVESLSAPDFLVQMAEQYPNELTLITVGPLTNVAAAIEQNPQSMKKYKEIISMGGSVGSGNITPVAEFNYWVDPEAAKIVFDFDLPITMLGLNLTHQIVLTPNDLHFMRVVGGEMGQLMAQIHAAYVDVYWGNYQIMGCVPHDSVAVAYAINPDLVVGTQCHVDVTTDSIVRGQTVTDIRGAWEEKRKNAFVGTAVKVSGFRDLLFETLFPDQQHHYQTYKKFLAEN